MKYYGILRKRNIENLLYLITRIKLCCSIYITFNKKSREHRKFWYKKLFNEHHKFKDKDSSIPEGKYYIPICIITSDLVMREDIPVLQAGLNKLLKKQYSHKFSGAYQSVDEILGHIENMDDTLTLWYDQIGVGRFDFESNNSLNTAISYFDVYIKNINSSYLSIEFHLYLSDGFKKMQTELINNNYSDDKGHIQSGFTNNSKKSGGKRAYTVAHYNDAHLKSDLICENFTMLKWRFYDSMQKYFPTLLHQKGSIPPSINIYKTNISSTDSTAGNFWSSVGILSFQGQFIDESKKLFFKINNSGRYEHNYRTDLIYIVNEETMKREGGYYSIDSEIAYEFAETFDTSVFKFALLSALNDLIANEIVRYKTKGRLKYYFRYFFGERGSAVVPRKSFSGSYISTIPKLNKVKLQKNRLNKLLKLRYHYTKDIDFYRRFISDDIWIKAEESIVNIFEGKHLRHSYDYRILTESPIAAKNKILEQMNVMCAEFNDKTEILQHLSAYKNEGKNRRINLIMLLLSIATVVFIIFPDLSKNVAGKLQYVWSFLWDIFML